MKMYESSLMQANEQPDLIDEVTEDLTYLGFLDKGDLTKALICRVQKTGTVTTRQFPAGRYDYSFSWDQRAAYDYQYKR